MPAILEAIVPLLLITLLGWGLRARSIIVQAQWDGFERVIYLVFFPALILHTLAVADLTAVPAIGTGLSLILSLCMVGGGLIASAPLLERKLGVDGPAFTSYFQGAVRWNTFVAVGLAGTLYGARGLTLIAVALAAILPLINVVSVLVMRWFVAGNGGGLQLGGLFRNPFVWSSLMGLAINLSGVPLPKLLLTSSDILGRAALGAALLLVGSGLRLQDMARPTAPMILTVVLKLVLLPVLAATGARLFGIAGQDIGVIVIAAAVPTAGASYILARQMGGDPRLMANIITTETLLSALTLPVMLVLLA